MIAESVRRDNVTRDFRHGTRGESASRCIGTIARVAAQAAGETLPLFAFHRTPCTTGAAKRGWMKNVSGKT